MASEPTTTIIQVPGAMITITTTIGTQITVSPTTITINGSAVCDAEEVARIIMQKVRAAEGAT